MKARFNLARMAAVLVCGGLAVAACGSQSSAKPTTTHSPTAAMVVKTATVKIDGKSQTILTDANGSPLYYFTADKSGKVTCTGQCATMWPPLTMPSGASKPEAPAAIHGTLGVVSSGDGAKVITYNGWPMYTYSKDKASGEPTGQGADGHKWAVITPTVQPAS